MGSRIEDHSSPLGTFEVPGGYLVENEVEDDAGEASLNRKRYNHVTLRELSGKEEDMLTAENISMGDKLFRIIANCIMKLETDEGESIPREGNEKLFARLPQLFLFSDIIVLLLRLRQLSIGNLFEFKVRCPEKSCKILQSKSFNLEKLVLQPMEGDVFSRIRRFNIRDGREIVWHMVTGKIEREFAKETERDKDKQTKATKTLMMRARTIDGEPVNLDILQDISMLDRMNLRKEFDAEGGIETEFGVTCNTCGIEWTEELQIGGEDFFRPTAEAPSD